MCVGDHTLHYDGPRQLARPALPALQDMQIFVFAKEKYKYILRLVMSRQGKKKF